MKTYILIAALLVASMLFFGCTQDETQIPTTDNNTGVSDTNVVLETQIVDQEITGNWVNENEVIDTGSVI